MAEKPNPHDRTLAQPAATPITGIVVMVAPFRTVPCCVCKLTASCLDSEFWDEGVWLFDIGPICAGCFRDEKHLCSEMSVDEACLRLPPYKPPHLPSLGSMKIPALDSPRMSAIADEMLKMHQEMARVTYTDVSKIALTRTGK